MQNKAPITTDPLSTLEHLDTFLLHVSDRHAAGLAWNGLNLEAADVLRPIAAEGDAGPQRADPAALLGRPGLGHRQAIRRDLTVLRRVLGALAARLRYGTDRQPLLLAIADGLVIARGATTAHDMRHRMLAELQIRLRRLRRDVMRRIDAIGSVNIRLDAWAAVGDAQRAGVRAYLGGVLQQQADFASYGRSSLGNLVAARRALDLASARVEARVRGEQARITRADSGPLTLAAVTRPTPPSQRQRSMAPSARHTG